MKESNITVFDDINRTNIKQLLDFYRKCEIKIIDKLPNPDLDESHLIKDKFAEYEGLNLSKFISEQLGISAETADILSNNMWNEINKITPSNDAAKNLCIKVVYWLNTVFKLAITKYPIDIYVQNSLSKQEIYILYLLSKLGNHIIVVDYNYNSSDTSYNLYSNIECRITQPDKKEKLSLLEEAINVQDISTDSIPKIILGEKTDIDNTLIYISGTPDNNDNLGNEIYNNLVKVGNKQEINSESKILVLKDGIKHLDPYDISKIKTYDSSSRSSIEKFIECYFKSNNDTVALEFLKSSIRNRDEIGILNDIVVNFVWLYSKFKHTEFNIIIVYGSLTKSSIPYIKYLSYIGKSVIVVDPMIKYEKYFDFNCTKYGMQNKAANLEYPENIKIQTIAKQAETAIQDMIYSDDSAMIGISKRDQFSGSNIQPIVMSTTAEEIAIIRDAPANVRDGFSISDNTVYIPVLYTKISGYNEAIISKIVAGDNKHVVYWSRPSLLFTDTYKSNGYNKPIVNEPIVNILRGNINGHQVIKNNGKKFILDADEFKVATYNKLGHLPDDKVNTICKAVQCLISEYEYVGQAVWEDVDAILDAVTSLTNNICLNIVWHDYIKSIPKLILLFNDSTDILNKKQASLIKLLHLLCWDIIILVPTGYSIGNEINQKDYIEHIIGEPVGYGISSMISNVFYYGGDSGIKKKGILGRLFNR